jgi:hypothetical protein
MNHFPFWAGLGTAVQHGKQQHTQKRNFPIVHCDDHFIVGAVGKR